MGPAAAPSTPPNAPPQRFSLFVAWLLHVQPESASPVTAFLEGLRRRHADQLPQDRVYETMMYRARNPPTVESLSALQDYLDQVRTDAQINEALMDDADAQQAIGELLAGMVWPDPAPLETAAKMLPDWNTVAITTLLHTQIPDYPIFGPGEAQGLKRLGYHVEYEDDPRYARETYGAALDALKDLRERARFDQVPESHHFLTRIVQASLVAIAQEDRP